jgi:hypothetical protein
MVLARRWKIQDDMRRTQQLTGAGVAGIVLFTAVFTVVGAARPAYDPIRHFVSVLSLGDGGWVQIANFVVCGVLIAGLGTGLARRWGSGPGAHWVPRLVTVAGVALVGCGLFLPDPSLGYPQGTPDELFTPLTWHGAVHFLCATLIGLALSAAVLLAVRRGRALGDRALTLVSATTAVAALSGCAAVLLFGGPDPVQLAGLLERIGIYAGWAWLAAVGILSMRTAE